MSSSGAHDWIGQTLADRYHVIEKIGAGGMGTVFKASDTRLGAEVVVKAPHPMMIKDAAFAARFKREIQSLVKLSHPHIVNVMDVGEHDELPFMVMEYLSGGSLEDRQRPCTPREVAGWLVDVADALDFMHSEGLVHRDIKPGNILFNSSGRAYLGDFGISKVVFESDGAELSGLTGTGTLIGTAEYMPPEILLPSRYGEVSDGRSDQYALAVTVYEMLSGRPPFQGDTIGEVSVRLANEEAVPLHVLETPVPESLSAVVGQALNKQPEDRYETCQAFASSFTAAVDPSGPDPFAVGPSIGGPYSPAAGGRQVTQLEASGPSRTPTIQEVTPDAPPRGTVPENVYVPVPDGLPETLADRGETVQERRPPLRTERFWRVVDDLPRHRVISAVAIFLFAVVVLVIVFSGGPKEPEGIAPSGLDPKAMGPSADPPPQDTTKSIDPSGPDPNAMGPSTDGASLPEGKSAQASIMEVTNSIGMKLRLIPTGEFMMGSPGAGEEGVSDDETQHRVSITKPFYLGVTEVTKEQYLKVTGKNAYTFGDGLNLEFQGPQYPVEVVSWTDAVEFCRKLSALPAEKAAGYEYRLPTEAEWEYACRAGTTTSYSFGRYRARLGGYGWFGDNSAARAHQVGEKKPNAWGLYDMHGNVMEWCQDWYGAYPSGSATNPTGATSGSRRVLRGGSWNGNTWLCRSPNRLSTVPGNRDLFIGFRVLRSSMGAGSPIPSRLKILLGEWKSSTGSKVFIDKESYTSVTPAGKATTHPLRMIHDMTDELPQKTDLHFVVHRKANRTKHFVKIPKKDPGTMTWATWLDVYQKELKEFTTTRYRRVSDKRAP